MEGTSIRGAFFGGWSLAKPIFTVEIAERAENLLHLVIPEKLWGQPNAVKDLRYSDGESLTTTPP